jgi:hypothetical protein
MTFGSLEQVRSFFSDFYEYCEARGVIIEALSDCQIETIN